MSQNVCDRSFFALKLLKLCVKICTKVLLSKVEVLDVVLVGFMCFSSYKYINISMFNFVFNQFGQRFLSLRVLFK